MYSKLFQMLLCGMIIGGISCDVLAMSRWSGGIKNAGQLYMNMCKMPRQSFIPSRQLRTRILPQQISPYCRQRRFLNPGMEEKLLNRIRIASGQGDLGSVEQTLAFIEKRAPDFLPQAEKAMKEKPVMVKEQQASQNGFKNYQDPFITQFYNSEDSLVQKMCDSFMHPLRTIFRNYDNSPLGKIEYGMRRNFAERAMDKTHVIIQNVGDFPTTSWSEWATRNCNAYVDRLYKWIFNENRMLFTFEPFSVQEKEAISNSFRHYIKSHNNKEKAVEELEDLLRGWSPVFGGMCDQPLTINIGIELMGNIYNSAIRKNTPLMKSIKKNMSYFYPVNEKLENSYAARQLIWKHMVELEMYYKKELMQLLENLK